MRKGIAVILLLVLSLGLTQCVMPGDKTSTAVGETTAATVPTATAAAPSDPVLSDTAPAPTSSATAAAETTSTTLPQVSTEPEDTVETSAASDAATEPTETMVWISRTGSKYHTKSTCSNMKDPSQISKEDAVAQGYTPCKRCC